MSVIAQTSGAIQRYSPESACENVTWWIVSCVLDAVKRNMTPTQLEEDLVNLGMYQSGMGLWGQGGRRGSAKAS